MLFGGVDYSVDHLISLAREEQKTDVVSLGQLTRRHGRYVDIFHQAQRHGQHAQAKLEADEFLPSAEAELGF